MDAKMSSFFLHEKLMSLRSTVSTVAQKCHGNFNFTHGNFNLLTAISTLLTAISILLMAISICSRQFQFYSRQFQFYSWQFQLYSRQFQFYSRQFQFYSQRFQYTHGNFAVLLTAISIFSRQRSRRFSLLSPPVSYGGRQKQNRWPTKRKIKSG